MPTIDDVLQLLELMPMGGIGPHGATLTEIEAAEAAGHNVENDAVYHLSQKAWLLLDQIRQQAVGTVQVGGVVSEKAK